jgi:hypothetical protein
MRISKTRPSAWRLQETVLDRSGSAEREPSLDCLTATGGADWLNHAGFIWGERLENPDHGFVIRVGCDREAERPAHFQHRSVFAQDFADQFADAKLSGDGNQPPHQQVAYAAALPVAAHGDRLLLRQEATRVGLPH